MKVLYITANVLGDAGANAAEIFPRLSVNAPDVKHVYVADFMRNRRFIKEKQFAEFLRLRSNGSILYLAFMNAVRTARKVKSENIDIIHVFYRQQNVPLIIFLRLALLMLWAKSTIILDHRSVNLARGRKGIFKKLRNQLMQPFAHRLAGNPWAVETNYYFVHKRKSIIDLGYDRLPEGDVVHPLKLAPRSIWFIGSLRPKNRKSEFLLEVFDRLQAKIKSEDRIEIHVAGPARQGQVKALKSNAVTRYYGKLPRHRLYKLLRAKPGIGIAFMNEEFHEYAPSLKFCEYAIMRFTIVAANTIGLRTQAERMKLSGVIFADENAKEWADKLYQAAKDWDGLKPIWGEADQWSYDSIFERQVLGLYRDCIR